MALVDDDLADMLQELGEDLTLSSVPVRGIFDAAGEVVVDGVVVIPATAQVPASAGAASGQVLVRGATSYRVRQVLPVGPDGLLYRLVLARL